MDISADEASRKTVFEGDSFLTTVIDIEPGFLWLGLLVICPVVYILVLKRRLNARKDHS